MNETGYIQRIYDLMSGLFFTSPTACTGAPNSTCLATGGLPQVGTSVREFEGEYDVSDPSRPEVTWRIFDIANCDDSTDGIEVTASFGPEGLVNAELVEADNGTLTAIIRHRFDQELSGPFPVTIRSKNGKEKRMEIWPPRYKTPEPTILGPCDYNPSPVIHGNIHMDPNPSEVYVGQTVTFSFPASLLAECDGTPGSESSSLKVHFIIENNEKEATFDGINYSYPWVFLYPGNQKVFMKVEDTLRNDAIPQYTSIEFWVKDPASSTNKPSVAISAPYAAHQGDVVNLSGNSDDPDATYEWTITPPTGAIVSLPGQNVTFTVDQIGRYDVRLTVTAGDGVSQNEATHSIQVYPPSVEIPLAGISSPDWARVNELVSFLAQNPNTDLYNYNWEVSDGQTASGPTASFLFTSTGTYMVRLTVSAKSDSSIRNSATRSITIVPAETPTVNVGIQAPFFAPVNTSVDFVVPNPTAGATYTWDFGDGTADSGISVSHSYSTTGEYQVRLNGEMSGTVNSITHNITIGTTPVPMPVVIASHNPPSGHGSGYNIIFNAQGSYSPAGLPISSYQIIYGDGLSENNATGIFHHAYPNPGAGNGGAYTAYLTITDANGQTNSTYVTVTIWGD